MLLALAVLQAAAPLAIERTGAFANRHLTESSGVVVSRTHPGVLWTHNDSGDEGFLYATDLTGADRGRVRVPGIRPVDAEDLGEGPCPAAAGRCLYLADTGDNRETRAWVTVYAVPEPAPPGGPADTQQTSAAPARLRLRYPDRPRDVEAAFVTEAGVVYLVSKGRGGTVAVYRVPRTAWTGGGVATAELAQTLAIAAGWLGDGLVTGATLSADGRRVALRTYGDVRLFVLLPDGTLGPTDRVCDVRGHEPQGEAIAYLDADRLVLTSEGTQSEPGPIHVVTCPR